ncbi:MAG: hypothetical protein VKN33_03710 [Candidatus Sericytochromatia bacterium]|nr:hypothetical protein [Candidatus Sericytochromatia bacterium]
MRSPAVDFLGRNPAPGHASSGCVRAHRHQKGLRPWLVLGATFAWFTAGSPAQAAISWGFSSGGTPVFPGAPSHLTEIAPSTSLRLHFEDEKRFDASIGWLHRAFRVSQEGTYALATHGIVIDGGANFGWYRLGTTTELAWLQRFSPGNPLQHDWGIVVETYIALPLYWADDGKEIFELSLHLPTLQNKPDPLIQPRLMATLWLK